MGSQIKYTGRSPPAEGHHVLAAYSTTKEIIKSTKAVSWPLNITDLDSSFAQCWWFLLCGSKTSKYTQMSICGDCMVRKGLLMVDLALKGDNIGLPLSNKFGTQTRLQTQFA